jgi:hypothetical protein
MKSKRLHQATFQKNFHGEIQKIQGMREMVSRGFGFRVPHWPGKQKNA